MRLPPGFEHLKKIILQQADKAKKMGDIVVRIGNFYGKKQPQVGLIMKGTDYDGTNPTSLAEAIKIIETKKG